MNRKGAKAWIRGHTSSALSTLFHTFPDTSQQDVTGRNPSSGWGGGNQPVPGHDRHQLAQVRRPASVDDGADISEVLGADIG